MSQSSSTTISGNWIAVSSGGETIYSSGSKTVDGPVRITGSFSHLTIEGGAVVSGLSNPTSAATSRYITATIQSGGILESSTLNQFGFIVQNGGAIDDINMTNGQAYVSSGTMAHISSLQGFIQASSGAQISDWTATGGYGIANAGAVFSGVTLNQSARISALSGGLVSGLTINSGGAATVSNGGTLADITVSSGGLVAGTASGILSGTIDNAGRISGGAISGPDTTLTTQKGAGLSNTTIDSGAVVTLQPGAVGSANTINGGTLDVSSGVTLSNNHFGTGGGLLKIESGAYWNNPTTGSNVLVPDNATIEISSGGSISNSQIKSGGNVIVSSGARMAGALNVSNGGLLSAMQVDSGATVTLQSAGVLSGLQTIESGGRLNATSATVYSSTLTNYGALYGGTLSGPDASLIATASGAASLTSGVIVESGATMSVVSNALVSGGSIGSGGSLYIDGGKTSNTVLDGGDIYLNNPLATNNTTYTSNGGRLHFQSGYKGTQTWTLSNHVSGIVESGASLPNTTVHSTAQLLVEDGGSLTSATVLSGGVVSVSSDGSVTNSLVVSNGGMATLSNVQSGATLRVTSGGDIEGLSSIASGGVANLAPSIVISNALDNSGALSGGTLSGPDANVTAYAKALVSGTIISSGATLSILSGAHLSGGTLNGGTLNLAGPEPTTATGLGPNGGTVNLESGYSNSAAWTAVTSNVTFNVSSGAILKATAVKNGGLINVDSGGALAGTTTVSSGGTISASNINSGATVILQSGGVVSGADLIASGGTLSAASGLILSGTTENYGLLKGGALSGPDASVTAHSGAAVSSTDVENGATLSIQSGAHMTGGTLNGGTLNLAGPNPTASTGLGPNGGTVNLESGYSNSAAWTAVTSNVTFNVSSGAILKATAVKNGGLINVDSGGALAGTTTVSSGGAISAANINSGATVILQSGGVVSGADLIASGGTLSAASGLILSGASENYGLLKGGALSGPDASVTAHSGAAVSSTDVENGATLSIQSGAHMTGGTLNGGTLNLAGPNPTASTGIGPNGGTINLESGYSNTAAWPAASSGLTFNVSSGAALNLNNVQNGGNVIVSSGGSLVGTTNVSSGGALVLNGTAGSGIVNLVGDGAGVFINGTDMPTNTISGFTTNDQIDLTSIPKSAISDVSRANNQITITTKAGKKYVLNAPGADQYGYSLVDDGQGGTIYTTCFAEGTLIATPSGDVAVEALLPGALVNTPKGAMPVRWLGHRAIEVASMAEPEENWLIRIRAGALADGVPARDLLVTQEHCMVFDGKLVPARMLVNGASIIVDRSIAAYTYYHVELDSHEAIWAEGALTESYLDSGNRDQFDNNAVTALNPARVAGGSETLPLDTSRGFVEPIHAGLAARAGAALPIVETTDDADLHLLTDAGEVIRAHRVAGDRVMFRLPQDVRTVALMSRTARPSETVGPFVDDRRDLGVLVGEIGLFGAAGRVALDAHLTDAGLPGWDVVEAAPCRWTNGTAVLPVGASGGDARVLVVQVRAAGPYAVVSGVAARVA